MKSLRPCLDLAPGDVVGFSGASFPSDLINITTYGIPRWSISHVGIVGHYGRSLIFESATYVPHKCAIQNAYVRGTQAQVIEPRISTYNGRVWAYRLAKPLKIGESYRLTNYLMQNIGKPYDDEGAMRAGARLWADIQAFMYSENLAALFCSEWVAAALRTVKRFDTTHIGKWSPNALCRTLVRRGIVTKPVRLK